jgi:hypothetical protein
MNEVFNHNPRRKIDSLPGDVCGIDGGAHQWKLEPHIRHIDRGVCDCGAVRYFSTSMNPESIKLRDRYNAKHGKPGKVYKGPPRQRPENKTLKPKEENMAAQINVKELHPETREKLGLTKEAINIAEELGRRAVSGGLSPVPPKPTGYKARGKYYEKHKPEILKDIEAFGEQGIKYPNKTMKRWGIAYATWFTNRKGKSPEGLAVKWGLAEGVTAPEKKEVTQAVRDQMAKARAARWEKAKKEALEVAQKIGCPADKAAAPPVEERYICMEDCQCPAGECKYLDKRTADPAAGNCPGYRPPKKAEGNTSAPPAEKAEDMKVEISFIDLPEVRKIIAEARAEIENLRHQLKLSKEAGFPPWRWYWVFFPTTVRQYFSALRELTK